MQSSITVWIPGLMISNKRHSVAELQNDAYLQCCIKGRFSKITTSGSNPGDRLEKLPAAMAGYFTVIHGFQEITI